MLFFCSFLKVFFLLFKKILILNVAAREAVSVKNNKLKEASEECEAADGNLEKLLVDAQKEGFEMKTSGISYEMKLKSAEISVGLILIKEQIVNAKVAEGYRTTVQEDRNQLLR